MAEPPVDISSSSLSRSKWARDSLGLRSGLSLRCGLVFLAVACAEAFVLGLCILTGPLGEGAATVVGLHLTSSQTGREEFHALASKPLAFLCLYPLESSEQGSFYYSDKFPVPKLGSKIVTQAVSELLRAVRKPVPQHRCIPGTRLWVSHPLYHLLLTTPGKHGDPVPPHPAPDQKRKYLIDVRSWARHFCKQHLAKKG